MATIPQTQQAAQVLSPGDAFHISIRDDVPVPEPGPNEVLVKLSCTGLCHSEVRAVLNWATYNPIIGHEGIGTIIKCHPSLPRPLASVGERVGVKWLYSACTQCSVCKKGYYHNCAQQYNTSRHVPGTLQQFVVADARFLTRIPAGIKEEVAAPLLCAGLTMLGALGKLDSSIFLHDVKKEKEEEEEEGFWVVISGSGGGLGHIGVQIASRIKHYRIIAIDTGEGKRQLSLDCGAEAFIDFKTEKDVPARVRELTGGEGAHATIVVPGTKSAFEMAPYVVRNMGMIVCVGLPRNDLELPISATMCAARGISIIGSSVGSEDQMSELLQYALDGRIKPVVKVYEFEDSATLIDKFIDNAITGKVVVKIPQ